MIQFLQLVGDRMAHGLPRIEEVECGGLDV